MRDCAGPAVAAGGGAVGAKKQGAKGENGLQEERLSLVHRYMGDAAAGAGASPPADRSDDSDKTPHVRPVEADAPPAEPEEAQTSRRSQQSDPPLASQLRHQARLPIYAWTRAATSEEEQRRDADWPHELVRLREERERAQPKLP